MSRSAAATAAGRQRALPRTPLHPRRVSGPAAPARREVAYPRPQRLPARPPLRVVAGGAAIATRVADLALDVSSSRLMDRLVRSRLWIGIVAFGLIGIVAMQVSMLKLNAGIGRAVETASTLERTNATLRGEVSRLSNGDRIQSLAGVRGFLMPAPADVTYLSAGDARTAGARAARRMRAPDRSIAGPAGSPVEAAAPVTDNLVQPTAGTTAPGQATQSAAGTTAPAGTTAAPATATTTGAPPATTGAPAATTATPPATTATPPATTAAPIVTPTQASPAGGVAPANTAPAP
jgi:hypothetical protein